MKAGSIAALFTAGATLSATIIEAISDLIFATACLPASAISVMAFFSASAARASAFFTMLSASARASATIFAASAFASFTRRSASARPFSKPSS